MQTFKLVFSKEANRGIKEIEKSYPGSSKDRLKKILYILCTDPYARIYGWETLKGVPDTYSFELNKKDRIVYQVDDERSVVTVLLVRGHYYDK